MAAVVTATLSSNAAPLTGLHATSFTVAFWLNPFDGGDHNLILDRAWKVALNIDGTVTFTIINSPTTIETAVTSTDVVVTNDWNHVVAIYNREELTISIFLNGVETTIGYTDEADDSNVNSIFNPTFQLGEVGSQN